MERSGKTKWGSLKVGLLITFGIAMLIYSSFTGGGTSIFESKDVLIVYFKNVNGLVKGAPVWLGGLEVGNVKSVHFVNLDANRRIKAELRVKTSVWQFLTEDTKVQLGTIGFLGDKYVEIIPGTTGLPLLKPGAVVPNVDEAGLAAAMDQVPGITTSIDTLLLNLRDISARLNSSEGTAGKILNDTTLYVSLVSALDKTSAVMRDLQVRQKSILEKLDATLDNSQNIMARIDNGEGSVGKMMTDEQLYDNLTRSTGHVDSILAKIDRGDGSAGALVNDAELYQEVRNLVVRINNLIADIEAHPRKYFKFSVF